MIGLLSGFCVLAFAVAVWAVRARREEGCKRIQAEQENIRLRSEADVREAVLREKLCSAEAGYAASLEAARKQAEQERNHLIADKEQALAGLTEKYDSRLREVRIAGEAEKAARDQLLEQLRADRAEQEKQWKLKLDLLKEEFRTVSEKLLAERTAALGEANREQLNRVIDPMKLKLDGLRTQLENAHVKSVELNGEMKNQLAAVLRTARDLQTEANHLAAALKGDSKVQGDWGEMILEDLLARSGLVKGKHYECQATLRDEAGNPLKSDDNRLMRPDVIVHYPDGKDVVIDSKVSLSAFVDYMNADDEAAARSALTRHVTSVRNHVKELVARNYTAYIDRENREAVDFVVMFVPNEAPYMLAMREAPSLWNDAFREKVLIVSPVNLMALLQIIQIAWTRDEQERNQREILQQAGMLLDRLYHFYDDFDEIGKRLEKAQESFQSAAGRLRGGNGRHGVVPVGERLKKIGVKMKKDSVLPLSLRTPGIGEGGEPGEESVSG